MKYRVLCGVGFILASVAMLAQSAAMQSFQTLKSLAGTWEGKSVAGTPVHTSFQVTSGGATLIQMLTVTGWPEKPTLYHLDGQRVMLTHYCSANNQPRMVAAPVDKPGSSLDFSLLDITNLARPEAFHMTKVVFHFKDKDHFTQEWAWREDGKDTVDTFLFERKQ